jgi:hypothetical protein
MPHAPPAETDILCEHCGQSLTGLSDDAACPKCGRPIADSTVNNHRELPAWEADPEPGWGSFLLTTVQIIFTPKRFFRRLRTRPGPAGYDAEFAKRHRIIAALIFGAAVLTHLNWMTRGRVFRHEFLIVAVYYLSAVGAVGLFLAITTWAATGLTRWEGTYRGYRVPFDVVRRVMNYHAAQLLPVAVVAAVTVIGYRYGVRLGFIPRGVDVEYLYVLCGEVVVAAFHLFRTYWIAMRNVLYANR